MPELVIVAVALLVAGAVVLAPLRHPSAPRVGDERDAAIVRHRAALEALRDVEADRRAGSLDERGYAEQRAEAEARAAATAADLAAPSPAAARPASDASGRRTAVAAAAVLGVGLVAGTLVPAAGIANTTVLNCGLALSQPAGEARRECLGRLLDELAADPEDAATLSAVADAYLAGTGAEDLARAAAALQLLIALDPERTDAYERVIAAYLRAGDHANARRAFDSYAALEAADPIELAFLDGLIALREGAAHRAVDAFDRFLELAPDDPRTEMVRALREEAAGEGG